MTESAEAEHRLGQVFSTALSIALAAAIEVQRRRAARARTALGLATDPNHETARRLLAERESAAVLWSRVDDREWIRTRPDEVAQAWASAKVWESVEPRAAVARAKFDFLASALYGRTPLVEVARESEDYDALASLLQRAMDDEPSQTVYYEMVPADERQEWLERTVWGPDTAEDVRIARSAELDDLHCGLPVAVLREMDEGTRAAWIALREQTPGERREWLRSWMQSEVWGPGLGDAPRTVRAEKLAALEATMPADPFALPPEAWRELVRTVRADSESQKSTEPSAPGAEQTPELFQESTGPDGTPVVSTVPTQAETEQQRQDRVAAAVREAWPEHVAGAVIDGKAFGAFTTRLRQLERQGWPMDEVLGMVPAVDLVGVDRYGKPVRDSAAFGEWHLKQLADSLPERSAAAAGIEQLERYVASHAPAKGAARIVVEHDFDGPVYAPKSEILKQAGIWQAEAMREKRHAASTLHGQDPEVDAAIESVWPDLSPGYWQRVVSDPDKPITSLNRNENGAERVVQSKADVLKSLSLTDSHRPPVEWLGELRGQDRDIDVYLDSRWPEQRQAADLASGEHRAADGHQVAADTQAHRRDVERGGAQAEQNHADDPTATDAQRAEAATLAAEHGEQAKQAESAREEHQAAADDYSTGAYAHGNESARLAGEGFPQPLDKSLKAASKQQGRAQGKQRSAQRAPAREQNRGR